MSLHRVRLIAVLLMAALTGGMPAFAQPAETREQRDSRMAWWRDARFGMFIHWGLYSIPAGEWNGQTNHAEWIRTTAQIPLAKYDEFVTQFNPVKFDANAWVRMAKDAGMKYITITTKHHDGFCLFDSKQTNFDVMSTPYGRDVMRQLADACRREGIRMCWYHSIMDWHHPDYLPRREWEKTRSTDGADFNRYEQYLHDEVTELLTNYGDIGVMWFDGEWESTWNSDHGRALYDLCRKLQPGVIVNNRVDKGRSGMAGMTAEGNFLGDFGTPEQEIPATGIPGVDWETCMTMNNNWGYNKNDHHWKSAEDLIRKLVDIASKGGNFLLNIGPTSQGEFPPEAVERLRAIGQWMKVNGESIYATSASPFAKLDWGRCTVKKTTDGATLYLQVFDWPADGTLIVPGVGNEKSSASLLGDAATSLAVSRVGSDLHIAVPKSVPDKTCTVIALKVTGEPIVYDLPTIEAMSDILVKPLPVTIAAPSNALEVRYTLDGSEPGANSPLADGSVIVSDSCTLKARTFHNGKPASGVATRAFKKVSPLKAEQVSGSTEQGLVCSIYAGEWSQLPDFSTLKSKNVDRVATIALPNGPSQERVARLFTGWINVPVDDVYVFALSSDDGSRLLIGKETVIDNDGLHSSTEKTGTIALAAGAHRLEVQHFNKSGGAECRLRIAPAGSPLKDVDPSTLSRIVSP